MNILRISAQFKIHDGKLNEFKKMAEEGLAIVKGKDQHTLQYDWFFSEDRTNCVVKEGRWHESN